jgi:heavy metal sensor kinase
VVYGPDGVVLERSVFLGNPREWPVVPADRRARALQGQEITLVQEQGDRRFLTLLLPLRTSGGARAGVLQLTRSADFIDRVESRVIGLLAVAGLVAVLACGLLAAWAARLALRPLDRIVEATRVTGAGDLTARLDSEREDEIGELASSFDRMLDRLEASFAAQQQLVADAAHELRTPLTALGGTVEMLQLGADQGDDAAVRRLLAATGKEVDRLVQLVDDLLTLSRLDEARPVPRERLDLQHILTDAIERVEGLARDRHLEARLAAGVAVTGNRDQLERLFLNLLDNALKYTSAGGRVEVRLAVEGGRVVVAVADTGTGIAPEDLPHIFDRFYRGDPSRSRRAGGAGLGLAIASGIVRRHGGTIEAQSVLGQGTTITVRLPLAA